MLIGGSKIVTSTFGDSAGSGAGVNWARPAGFGAVAGEAVGQEWGSDRSDLIVATCRDLIAKYFPKALEVHPTQHDYVTFVFDSSGGLVKMGHATRPALKPDEKSVDREVLKATLPGVDIETFAEWGLADVTMPAQAAPDTTRPRGSGVTLMYAFMKS